MGKSTISMAIFIFNFSLEVQQFRPPVDSCTAELPAGLIDKGETAEEAIGAKMARGGFFSRWDAGHGENHGKTIFGYGSIPMKIPFLGE
jgi:hypothetical protein